ncbi:MAG: TlpA disulfide reductase family protein [Acidobacteriota bacterium]
MKEKRSLLLAVLLAVLGPGGMTPGSAEVRPPIPRPASYFILPTWDGKIVRLSSLKGQVILLEFFQTWCPDCQRSAPALERLHQRYKAKGLTVLGISHDKEKAAAIEPYVKKYGLSFPVLVGDLSIAVNFIGITPEHPMFNIPYIVLIDRSGNVVGQFEEGRDAEATDEQLLEKLVQKLLAEKPPDS